jgi:alkanesulfonate monooxygenase SsuD/methylene tetrahydromethanopterin reductase-like flavin-dependent oxidoreductase (luciferase family)
VPLEEATERFEESIGLIKRALTSDERFSHHSKRWHFEDIIVEPPPVQRPHPPMWLAAGRPESIRKAAADGYSLLLDQFATFELTLERLRIYREAVEAAGRTFDPMNVGVARGITIIRNEEERERALGKRMASLDRMNRLATTADRRYVSSMASDPNLRQAAEGGTLIGTPEEIIEMIRHLRDGGVGYILLSSAYVTPGLMKTFAEEVMPAFA